MFKDFYFAHVQFQKLDHAKKALEQHKFPTFGGIKCRVLPFSKNSLAVGPKKQANAQLFVKSLPKEWTHEELSGAFEKFGKVMSAKVSIDPEFNSRQYGFVQLDSESAMHKAIEEMNDFEVDGSKLNVCEFVPRQDRLGTAKPRCSTNLYVKNFPQLDFTEE